MLNYEMSVIYQNKSDAPVYEVVWSDGSSANVIPVRENVSKNSLDYKRNTSIEIEKPNINSGSSKSIEELNTHVNNIYHIKPIEHEVIEEIFSTEKSGSRHKMNMKQDDKLKMEGQRKKFMNRWYNIPEFSNWLQESPIPGFAFCLVCRKDLQPGKSELLKHANTLKHTRKMIALGHNSVSTEPLRQHVIDLRSDTVSKPSGLMKEVMNNIKIQDIICDVDISVNELEMKLALLLGKESALFLPSGTMANLIAIRTHCWSLNAIVIVGDKSMMNVCSMGILDLLGVGRKTVKNLPDGTLDLEELTSILELNKSEGLVTVVVCIENTHEWSGGQPISSKYMNEMNQICLNYGALIHVDGARLINATVSLSESMEKICEGATSVMFQFDRGIGAPGGSVLAGPSDFINRALLIQKSYGGIMRCAGILAATCLVGMNNNIKRIATDHSNAVGLAKGICSTNSSAITVDVRKTVTNIVLLTCDNVRITPQKLCERLMNITPEETLEFNESIFIKVEHFPPNKVKLVLHGDITAEDVKSAVRKFQLIIKEIDESGVDYISEVFQT